MATTSKTKSVSSLNKQLAGVASKAKSLGINTGKADAMVAQTTAQGSKSFKGSSYEKDYQASAIAADGLAPTAPINLPEKPTVPDVGNLVAPGNIGLQSTAEGMYTVDPATGMTTMAAPTDPLAQNQQGRLADMFAAYEGMGSGEADLAKLEKENRLQQKRQAVTNYTGQLNAIVAKSQAEQLGLEGQGRGITESIIGGQQAQINREAAIQALPVQAQLAAAQGDLEMAQAHVDKLFAIKRQDAQALFQFKSNVINSVYDFADKQEQRRLDEVSKQEDRKYSEQQDFLKTQRNLLSSALQQGAPASVISGINGAQTQEDAIRAAGQYNGDILARQAQQAQIRSANASAAANEYQISASKAAIERAERDAAAGILTPEQVGTTNSINEKFSGEPIVKEYNTMVAKQIALDEVLQNGIGGVQDLTLVYEYMKALDPTSVVREAEFDNAAGSGNIFAGAFAKFNKGYFGQGGFLPDNVKESFVGAVRASQDAKTTQYYNLKSEYAKRINNTVGTQNGADYLTAYEGAAPLQKADWSIVTGLEGASEADILEIMNLTNSYSTASR